MIAYSEQVFEKEEVEVVTLKHLNNCIPKLQGFLTKHPNRVIGHVFDDLLNLKDIIERYSKENR